MFKKIVLLVTFALMANISMAERIETDTVTFTNLVNMVSNLVVNYAYITNLIARGNINAGGQAATNFDRITVGAEPYTTDGDIDVVANGISKIRASTYSATAIHKPYFMAQRARGTRASPTAVQLGDDLGSFWVWGHNGVAAGTHDGTGFNPAAGFLVYAAENWSSNVHGATTYIQSTHLGTNTLFNDVILSDGIFSVPYQSAVRSSSNISQSIANTNYTALVLQVETIDAKGEFDPSTCTFTASQAGTYLVHGKVQWSATDASKVYQLWFVVGGALVYVAPLYSSATFAPYTQNMTELISLSAGGTVQGKVYQTSGGAESLDQYGTSFIVLKVK